MNKKLDNLFDAVLIPAVQWYNLVILNTQHYFWVYLSPYDRSDIATPWVRAGWKRACIKFGYHTMLQDILDYENE
jgi:hypothetical protein